jgi:hypothetical protein
MNITIGKLGHRKQVELHLNWLGRSIEAWSLDEWVGNLGRLDMKLVHKDEKPNV